MLDVGCWMGGDWRYYAKLCKDCLNVVDCALDGVVDDLVLVILRAGQFSAGDFEAALDGGFRFRAAGAKSAFQFLNGAGPQKDAGYARQLTTDFFGPLNVDI